MHIKGYSSPIQHMKPHPTPPIQKKKRKKEEEGTDKWNPGSWSSWLGMKQKEIEYFQVQYRLLL